MAARHRSATPRAVVLLVLDGLGWDALASPPPALLPEPRHGIDGGPITTVVPSTTAAALTSITTGLAAGRSTASSASGSRSTATCSTCSRWQPATAKRAARPVHVQRHAAVPRPRRSRWSRGSSSARPGFTARAPARRRVRRLARRRRRWSSTAAASSRRASRSSTRTTRASTRSRTSSACTTRSTPPSSRPPTGSSATLLDALPADAALLVTADHGQVHLGARAWIDARALARRSSRYGRRRRFRYLHAPRRAPPSELAAAATDAFGERGLGVLTRRELLDDGWLGPGPGRRRPAARIGDVVLAARDAGRLRRPGAARASATLRSRPRLASPRAEMLVPLPWPPEGT